MRVFKILLRGKNNLQELVRPLEKVTFVRFRMHLKQFLLDFNLPASNIKRHDKWKGFLAAYVFLIADCRLEVRKDQRSRIKRIRKRGQNQKIQAVTLVIIPPFISRHAPSSVPSLLRFIEHDDGRSIPIPCVFYSLTHGLRRNDLGELDLWRGLVTIGSGARLS